MSDLDEHHLGTFRAGSEAGVWLVQMLDTAIGNSPERQRAKILFYTSEEGKNITITAIILDRVLTPGMLEEILGLFWRAFLTMKAARPASLLA